MESKDLSKLNDQSNVFWEDWNISREEREKRNGHKALVIWFTGISGAGKSTIAKALEDKLWSENKRTIILDGDQVRHGLNNDLGFSEKDRSENIRRVGEVARLFFEHGNIVICAFVSPILKDREKVRGLFNKEDFIEISVTCDSRTAEMRDPKGLYKKAKDGKINNLTGFNSGYEKSLHPEMTINTDVVSVKEAVELVMSKIKE